jgi:hypothetical protein
MSVRSTMLCLVVFVLACAGPADADTIAITRGSLTFNGSFFEPLTIAGDRGFTLHAVVGNGAVDFVPSCGSICAPGTTFSLGAFWTGSDLLGSASIDGRTFDDVGGLSSDTSAQARFSGAISLPLAGRAVTVRSPFAFEGSLAAFHPLEGLPVEQFDLFGRGTAIGTFSRIGGQDEWNIDRVVFQFDGTDPVPEPATLLLVATSITGALAQRRRNRLKMGRWQ